MNELKIAIGADIGGSHISCSAIDLSTNEILAHTYTFDGIDSNESTEVIINAWSKVIKQCIAKANVKEPVGIGFAMPGPFDYVNGIALFEGVQKFQNLNGVNIIDELKKVLQFNTEVSIRFINDATAFAVGAVWADESMANENVLAITLGTGFGSAFIENTLPILTGETVPRLGCLYHLDYKGVIADETFSTRGLLKAYKEKSNVQLKGVKEIADLAINNKDAKATFNYFGANLAEFLLPWIKKASIHSVVIGGNIAKAYSLFEESFTAKFNESGINPKVKVAVENDLFAIMGAARLAEPKYWNKIKSLLKYM